jgi:hypothetical protein
MLNALLAASVFLAVPEAEQAGPPEPSKWEIFVGLSGGLRTESLSAGGVGLIGINRRIFSWLRPEISVGLGAYAGPFDVQIPIKIGTRIEWPSDARIKPYVFLAFAHVHENGWQHAVADPVGGILGLSSHGEHGVDHRSGLDSGVGVSADFAHLFGSRYGVRINLRASLMHLMGEGPLRYADLLTTVGLIF